MQTKRQLKRCTQNVHPSFADFQPRLGVNFHILLTQNWLWESSLSLLSLWCILFQIKLGSFRENLNLKKHLGPKNGWSSPSTFWHRLIYIWYIKTTTWNTACSQCQLYYSYREHNGQLQSTKQELFWNCVALWMGSWSWLDTGYRISNTNRTTSGILLYTNGKKWGAHKWS